MTYDTIGLYGTIWVSVMTFLSALFQVLKKPALSKFFGRLMGLDVGGYIRSFERWREVEKYKRQMDEVWGKLDADESNRESVLTTETIKKLYDADPVRGSMDMILPEDLPALATVEDIRESFDVAELSRKISAMSKSSAGMIFAVLMFGWMLPFGCMPQVHSDIQKVIVFEQQVHSEALQLKSLADACIPTLPIDKQQAAREEVSKRFSQLTEVLSTKDELLQAALESSADSVNIASVAVEIMKSLDSIVSLLRTFGVASPELSRVEVRASVMRAKAGTL